MINLDKVRAAAIRIIYSVSEKDSYSNVTLSKVLRREKFKDIDRRFCTELVYGTIKMGQSIDWIISKYINRPLKDIDPMILAILRVGIYQIFFLDKIPNSAAVNESVEITKHYRARAANFVNAVLRSAIREPKKAEFPSDDSAQSIAISMFHPQWIVERWIKQFGVEETKKLCAADNKEPPISLRVNLLKTTRAAVLEMLADKGIKAERSKFVNEGIICRDLNCSLDNLDVLQNGYCQVQDESSMIVSHILAPRPGNFIIDCCAAPGGKATHIAEIMKNRGRVVANDIYKHKIEQIEENAKRLGIKIIETMQIDARMIGAEFEKMADGLLIDAPCSGLGVLRRKADLRWKKSYDELIGLPKLQLEIINGASSALKVGGTLVYSTCTLEKAENDWVIKKFLNTHQNFKFEMKKTLFPHIHNTDGFFIAKMRRIK